MRTTNGSLLTKAWVPDFDAPVVERLRDARSHRGRASGEAAAAVAAGMGPLAQGSDGAGSIRIPASFCGVFGFKPSFGVIPQPGNVEQVGHVGPLSRTVDDTALFLDAAAGRDERDLRIDFADAARAGARAPRGLESRSRVRLGRPRGRGSCGAPRAHSSRLVAASTKPSLGDPCSIFEVISATSEAGEWETRERLAEKSDLLDPRRLERISPGWEFSGAQLAAAHARRSEFYKKVLEFMEPYDLLLTPTLPITAFAIGRDHPGRSSARTESLCWQAFTYPFNMTGQPAASVPCGITGDGLPVGLQIVGRWHTDATVIGAARAFEEARPWQKLASPAIRSLAPERR